MPFQEKVESWRQRTQANGIKLPLLVGLTALAVIVLVWVGSTLFHAATSDGFSLVYEEEARSSSPRGEDDVAEEEPTTIFVYVSGCVVTPGVVELPLGSRVCDALEAAGGFSEGADREGLNLARVIVDGEQLSVAAVAAVASEDRNASEASVPSADPAKININTATAEELDALPGVGISTAEKIIADRKANGPFSSPEELKRVSGIGDKKYAALADAICVG